MARFGISRRPFALPAASNRQRYGSIFPNTPKLLSGFDDTSVAIDYTLPPIGLVDIDRAFFDFFDKTLALQVATKSGAKPVPILFAGGERFALTKSDKPIRDKTGAVITPIVVIKRVSVTRDVTPDNSIGVDVGAIVFQQRLSRRDRKYQSLLNRFGLINQDDVANSASGSLGTSRVTGTQLLERAFENAVNDNVVETLYLPMPEQVSVKYEIYIWTMYTTHMNQIVERILTTGDLGGVYNIRIDTPKGYWFIAYFDNDITFEDNISDYSDEQRLIRAKFTANVPAFLFASRGPSDGIPARYYVSATSFSFDVCEAPTDVDQVQTTYVRLPFVDPANPVFMLSDVEPVGYDGRIVYSRAGVVGLKHVADGRSAGDRLSERYVSVVCDTGRGERVYRVGRGKQLDSVE